jgi:aminodeoxyfutalosine deaminase
MTNKPRTLRARYVFPVAGPPIPNGEVVIEGEAIAAVGAVASGDFIDLGNSAILPGFVNAHTHLEFSDLKSPLGRPGMGFADWIRTVIESRRCNRPDRGRAVETGLRESLDLGTTTVGEIAQPDWTRVFSDSVPSECVTGPAQAAGPGRGGQWPRLVAFFELIATTRAGIPIAQEKIQEIEAAAASWPREEVLPGLSPHAPYSAHPDLFRLAVSRCAERKWPLAFHLAESREELELLRTGSGPLRDFLMDLPACDPALLRSGVRPLDYLRTLSAADRVLVAHGNYLDDEEIDFLARHAHSMTVVYCPRTHAYFGHDRYPLEKMLAARVKVALGTDSRASSPDLSVLAEMRRAAASHPSVPRGTMLRMATLDGAAALGLAAETGSLERGKYADLVVVGLPDREAADPHELLFDSALPVLATWRRGRAGADRKDPIQIAGW